MLQQLKCIFLICLALTFYSCEPLPRSTEVRVQQQVLVITFETETYQVDNWETVFLPHPLKFVALIVHEQWQGCSVYKAGLLDKEGNLVVDFSLPVSYRLFSGENTKLNGQNPVPAEAGIATILLRRKSFTVPVTLQATGEGLPATTLTIKFFQNEIFS